MSTLVIVLAFASVDPRVVFRTAAGDLVFSLDKEAAPRTVEQFEKLVRAGVYDSTLIGRVHPGFFVQVAPVEARTEPLRADQSALIHKLPLEVGGLKHVRGALSFSHPEGEPDSGETSFSIMLGGAPHLDGKYTVFGKLEAGEDVLNEILRVPRNENLAPLVRVSVFRADVFDSITGAYVTPAHPVPGARDVSAAADPARDHALSAGLLLIVSLSVASLSLRAFSPRLGNALNLVVLLVGAFLSVVLLLPEAQHRPLLAVGLLLGVVAVFKALGRFESAPR